MWGGFGSRPDAPSGPAVDEPLDATGPGPDRFTNPPLQVTAVHCVTVADDGLVYVCDRDNRRIQVFTLDGTYRTQLFVNRAAPSRRSASRVAFSPDAAQRFMYVADFNSRVVVVERRTLAILDAFGSEGNGPGQFRGIHHLATDSSGNLYVAESNPGSRVQKFVYRGLGVPSASVAD
jgi:DNA-binding beta-propeller fold protein YncE